VKSRYKKDESDWTFKDLVSVVEEVLSRSPLLRRNTSNNRPSARTYPTNDEKEEFPKKVDYSEENKSQICSTCKKPGHNAINCWTNKNKKRNNNVDCEDEEEEVQFFHSETDSCPLEEDIENKKMILAISNEEIYEHDSPVLMIEITQESVVPIAEVKANGNFPHTWDDSCNLNHIEDARKMHARTEKGLAHINGENNLTQVYFNDQVQKCLLDGGASCSIVGDKLLNKLLPNWRDKLLPVTNTRFISCSDRLAPLGVIELSIIFPHLKGSIRIADEFLVMKNTNVDYFILGNDFLVLYGFDIVNSKDRYFTIGNGNKSKNFPFIPSKIPPAVMYQASTPDK
jgi:hypothetical protein